MKTLIKAFRFIIAVGMGLLAAIAIGFFGLLIYDKQRDLIGITLAVLLGLLAAYVGYQVFRTARSRGILAFSAAVHASPDMDNLEPSGDSEVRRVNVREYVALFEKGENIFQGGAIRIWGDWKGRALAQPHAIKEVRCLQSERLLLIHFTDESQISVWKPQIITESPTYLKILKADKVKWEWGPDNLPVMGYFIYFREGRKIRTETNTDWKSDEMDILSGEPALLILK